MIPYYFFIGSALANFFISYWLSRRLMQRAKPVVKKGGRLMPPEIGGIVLFVTLTITFLIYFVAYSAEYGFFWGKERKLFGVAVAAGLAFLLGYIDDQKSLHFSQKLFGQILVASIIPLVGFRLDFVTNVGGELLHLPLWLGSASIVLWLVFMMNAVNLIDGLDGLAAGVVAMGSFTIFLLGFQTNPVIASGALMLSAALIGVLPFNVYPAKFYLGDSGSLLIGFLVGVFSLFFHVKTYVAIAVLIPAIILFVPIINTMMVIIDRLQRGKNPLKGDIHHLHYRLHRQGMSHRATVLFLWGVALSLCALVVIRQYLPYRPRTILFFSSLFVIYTLLVQGFLLFLKVKRKRKLGF